MATLAIFDWPGAVKNACWGASPNPALWDKMSQRDWLRHRRYRVCSLSSRPSVSPSRWSMLALTATASRTSFSRLIGSPAIYFSNNSSLFSMTASHASMSVFSSRTISGDSDIFHGKKKEESPILNRLKLSTNVDMQCVQLHLSSLSLACLYLLRK